MTKSKFNSKFRMSGLRSTIFILIFVAIICVPVYFAVKTLTPAEYIAPANSENNSDTVDEVEQSETDNEEDSSFDESDGEIIEEDSDEETSNDLKNDKKAKKGVMPGVDADAFKDIDEGKFVYVVNKNMALTDGKSEANILIYNPKENTFNLSLKIEVNGEEIYKTGILRPNYYIENDVFDIELSKGEYDTDIEVIAYDVDSNEKQEVYTDSIKITVSK